MTRRSHLRVVRDPRESRRIDTARLHLTGRTMMTAISAFCHDLERAGLEDDAKIFRFMHDQMAKAATSALGRARR